MTSEVFSYNRILMYGNFHVNLTLTLLYVLSKQIDLISNICQMLPLDFITC